MAKLVFGPEDALSYVHTAPENEAGCTFVFFNALTGESAGWDAVIGPMLRKAGHGTLLYNMRGQADSPFSPSLKLDADLAVQDALRLLSEVSPRRPVFVGLSIGGLFAARAWLSGAEAVALVLINTLRRDGPRVQWIGDALVRAAEVGGLDLFRDLYMPLLMNEEWQARNRSGFLKPGAYTPLKPESGHYKLLAEAGRTADWDLPYQNLTIPTLVITGLQDHVFLDMNDVERLFAMLPRGTRVDMADAGHLIPAEGPEKLGETLLTYAEAL